MKLSLLFAAVPLVSGLNDIHFGGPPASHFTITAMGDLVPSGYTGYKYSIRFLIRDKLNKATLTLCSHTWKKKENYPRQYIPCNDPDWQWYYAQDYAECGFSLNIAHSKITRDEKTNNKINATSYATLIPEQVPCAIGASKNFTCIYGASGAQLCGLGKGTILQVPVRQLNTTTSKTKKSLGRRGQEVVEFEEEIETTSQDLIPL